jgi:hypothetical protein
LIDTLQSNRLLTLLTILALSVALSNCGTTSEASVISGGVPNAAEQTGQASPPQAVKVAVVLDQTGSRTWTRTPEVKLKDLSILIELLCGRGGEIGFGLVRADSNRSLVRLRIDQPPIEPQPPSDRGNAFVLLEQRARHEGQLVTYERLRAGWDQISQSRIDTFLSSIEPLLDSEVLASASDVWGAVRRMDLFLAEDDAAWGGTASRWALLVTDGKDNVGQPVASLSSGARLVVVNGSGSTGELARLNPVPFESLDAAVRYLIAQEESR